MQRPRIETLRHGPATPSRIILGALLLGVLLALVALVPGLLVAAPKGSDPRHTEQVFRLRSAEGGPIVVEWDRSRTRAAARAARRLDVARFPLRHDLAVDLELTPFSVTSPATRFVVGRRGLPDQPIPFDPSSVSLFRGRIAGRAGSRVLLALSDAGSTGFVDLGPGATRYRIASRGTDGSRLPAGRTQVFETTGASGAQPGVPLCGTDTASHAPDVSAPAPPRVAAGAIGPTRGLMHLQLAVETDYEYYSLFDDPNAALTYLVQMYAEVSDIYIRDVDTRVELAFARIWTTPNDLFNQVDPSPLVEFQNHWNANMSHVTRDAAQLVSGRRDYPFGGQAYLSTLCTNDAYSVVGYILGFIPDPSRPSVYSYDIGVTAHELGHNCGTGHTHDASQMVDRCHDPNSTPQRGTIMSYCSQTWSGMNANEDEYFHAESQRHMDPVIASAGCVVDDCNLNGIADATDIAQATSNDANANGIPDECEDCNGNMVLDNFDIITLFSADLNANAIPDECEPDCNANLVPDSVEIADDPDLDEHGNDIPDVCEADCNANGFSDYSEIQLTMPLDIDRDRILDSCEDCDSDGTLDLADLDAAHFAWVASGQTASSLRAFHAETGVLTDVSDGGSGALANAAQDLIIAGDRVLVTSKNDNRVMRFDLSGTYQGDLVAPGVGGLSSPAGLTLSPDGSKLLVASTATNNVLAYEPNAGSPMGVFVTAGSGGLSAPFGMVFGPNGLLYVTSAANQVLEYDGDSGAFRRIFVSATDNGGLDQPRGIAFKQDGNLLVASFGSNEVLEYDGATGAALGRWARAGTPTILNQRSPWGIRIAPNGNVFVARTGPAFGSELGADDDHDHHDHDETDILDRETRREAARRREGERAGNRGRDNLHLTNAQIYEYDGRNGNYLRAYIGGNDHGLSFPTGFDFIPGFGTDCNVNYTQDACDISSGFSQDADLSGVPDECEADCDENGTFDLLDIIPHGPALDCNGNRSPDICDTSLGVSADCNGNAIPDECEADCNGNMIADACDIATGAGTDCNNNGVLDACDVTETFESNHGWLAGVAGDTATSGIWVRVDPIGNAAAPADDHTPGSGRVCFVTGQGIAGGAVGDADVDGGTTTLRSPAINLLGMDESEIGYWRWFSNHVGANSGEDVLTVSISNDGGSTWTLVETVGPTGPQRSGGWFHHQFRVADFVAPTANIVMRFVASDTALASTVEAAIDDLMVVAKSSDIPGEVQNLVVGAQLGPTSLGWTPQGGGVLYDVIGGDASSLIPAGSVADAQCLANGSSTARWVDSRPDPALGQTYYYLVRAEQSCNPGTYGFATSGAERFPTTDCP